MEKRILYYLNQFFGQIGGEDKADFAPVLKEGSVGPAMGFSKELGDAGKVVATFICGDNYINENNEAALAEFKKAMDEVKPDLVVVGPSFNAGRYGMASALIAQYAVDKYDVPVVSGMYEENPGLEITRLKAYTVPTGNSAGDMRAALPKMAAVAKKLLAGEQMIPDEDGYFKQGKRVTGFSDKIGAVRAVEMLMKRFNDEPYVTEMPMPSFDLVEPAAPIADLTKARIALVTTGGIVPVGNPDRIQSASAQKWGKYNIADYDNLAGDFITIHGGFDPMYCNESPDRVLPLDSLRKMEKEGKIGKVHEMFYTTTGTGTAVGNSIIFGKEIGKELKEAGVDGVILTST